MATSIEELIKDIRGLVSLPEVAIQVIEMVDDPNCDAAEIGKVISRDPGMTARLLRIANSPLYGFSKKIDTIVRAVAVLGTHQIRDLVLTTSATKLFDGIPNELISVEDFWHHSLFCGLLARILGMKGKVVSNEALFVAGLLHDIGHLIMFNRIPELMHQVILCTLEGSENIDLYLAEREIIGFDHTQVGGELAKEWHLPTSLSQCIEFHHEPALATNFRVEATIICIANVIASQADLESSMDRDNAISSIDANYWEITGLTDKIVLAAVERTHEEISEVESMIF